MFRLINTFYELDEREIFLLDFNRDIKKIKTNKKIIYYNVPCAFDIETTSTYVDNEPVAFMYHWQFGINGRCIHGRTWEELTEFLDWLQIELGLHEKCRLIVYVHNLEFEFQFMRKYFSWSNSYLATDSRKMLFCCTLSGYEFRCSYRLSGYKLSYVAKKLRKYPVEKMVGDLDYSLVRHSKTPLTDKEIKYCLNDILVVMAYIQELIEEHENNITLIPLTKTGFVRKDMRNRVQGKSANNDKYNTYRQLMNILKLENNEEYKLLKQAFQGGFTHANAFYSGKVLTNVSSYDFTSSYPYVMLSEKFPMSKGTRIEVKSYEELRKYIKNYACLFVIRLTNVVPKFVYENYLSYSKCRNVVRPVLNNGRIVTCDCLETTVTELDFEIIEKCYKWDSLEIGDFIRYEKQYLPTDFIKGLLKYYKNKTSLKGVEGEEVDYLRSKEMLNSSYGMMVTDISREKFVYSNDEWSLEEKDIDEDLKKYNKSKNRFLFFPWGVWITAYARRNLFTGIFEIGHDYIYSDTDSIKFLNHEKHKKYFEEYNAKVVEKLKIASAYYRNIDETISFSDFKPKTIKGKEKLIGVWDYEGTYAVFKTLGAKRYLYLKLDEEGNAKSVLTVSGVNKEKAMNYLINKFGLDGIFEAFNDMMEIPPEYTGKMRSTYLDEDMEGYIKDYQNNTAFYSQKSGIHLEPTGFTINMSAQYLDYIKGIREYED